MDYKSAKQYAYSDKSVLGDSVTKPIIKKQAEHLLKTFDNDKDVQAIKDELNGLISSVKVLNDRDLRTSAIALFKYIYYECSGKAGHLIYNYSYIAQRLAKQHYNMYNVANNLIIKHFGVGTEHQALDVHATGRPGNMRIVVAFI